MEYVPERIKGYIEGKGYTCDDVGMSDSKVYIFEDMVLKCEPCKPWVQRGADIMRWLEGKLAVPRVIEHIVENGRSFLLMSRVRGKMICDRYYMERPEVLMDIIGEAFEALWSVDISGCPVVRDLDSELAEARYRLENGLVDTSDAEPDTFGEGGFKDHGELLEWLENNKPSFEPVFSHGDFCLPNILAVGDTLGGFIDLGDSGIGDKWRDIALCYRSLKHNSDGTYGLNYPDIEPDKLFERLGVEPDYEKLRYYILLDELF